MEYRPSPACMQNRLLMDHSRSAREEDGNCATTTTSASEDFVHSYLKVKAFGEIVAKKREEFFKFVPNRNVSFFFLHHF